MKKVGVSLFISQILFFTLFPLWLELTKYLHGIVIVIVWLSFTGTVLFLSCFIFGVKIALRKLYFDIMITFYSIGLFVLLYFRPANQTYGTVNLIPLETIFFYLSGQVNPLIAFYNLSANIGLFVPLGIYYCYVNKNRSFVGLLFISICSIFLIESLQFLTKRGSFDIDDVILNVFGLCLGFWVFPFVRRVIGVKE